MLYPYTCRRRLEYGLTINPNSEVDDQELMSAMKLIRGDAPYSGVSMMTGSLRAIGIIVTWEQVHETLRNIDPLGTALRWPAGATKRCPYSVHGPNSLWHIGIAIVIFKPYSTHCHCHPCLYSVLVQILTTS